MSGRELYGLYRDCHGGQTGIRLESYDELSHQQRMVWVSLAEEVANSLVQEISDAGG